jgi:hypothetical protein
LCALGHRDPNRGSDPQLRWALLIQELRDLRARLRAGLRVGGAGPERARARARDARRASRLVAARLPVQPLLRELPGAPALRHNRQGGLRQGYVWAYGDRLPPVHHGWLTLLTPWEGHRPDRAGSATARRSKLPRGRPSARRVRRAGVLGGSFLPASSRQRADNQTKPALERSHFSPVRLEEATRSLIRCPGRSSTSLAERVAR